MTLASELVDWGALGQAVYLSVGIGLAVLIVAAFAVIASLRAADERSAGNDGAVITMGAITALCLATLVAGVVGGIYVMTQ